MVTFHFLFLYYLSFIQNENENENENENWKFIILFLVFFIGPLYKAILDKQITLSDIESVDADLYRNLQWTMYFYSFFVIILFTINIRENDVTEMGFTFSADENAFGKVSSVDLIENGSEVPVTNENKAKYVK